MVLKKCPDKMERKRGFIRQRDVTTGDTVTKRYRKISLQMRESGGGKGQLKVRIMRKPQANQILALRSHRSLNANPVLGVGHPYELLLVR